WTDATIESMRTSNQVAARLLVEAGIRAATDVSGFGLAGHLRELLVASGAGARLRLDAIPALPAAHALLAAGWASSRHLPTRRFREGPFRPAGMSRSDPRLALLCDPQTSGGLLAAVPPACLAELTRKLAGAGALAAVIGEVIAASPGSIAIE